PDISIYTTRKENGKFAMRTNISDSMIDERSLQTTYEMKAQSSEDQRLREEKIDPTNPKLKYFDKYNLERLKRSGLTINAYKSKLFKEIEATVTEEEFRRLYFERKLSTNVISKKKGINPHNLNLWAKDKLGIKLQPRRKRKSQWVKHNDPRLKYFNQSHLKRLEHSGLSIDAFKSKIYERIEVKITEEKFRKLYFDEKLSLKAISKKINVNLHDVSLWAKDKLSIKPRGTRKELHLPPEYIQRYLNGESAYSLAQEFGVSTDGFLNALRRIGVKIRGYKDAAILRARKGKIDKIPPDYIQRYIDGEGGTVLARELGMSRGYFLKLLREQGITVHKPAQKIHLPSEYIQRYKDGEGATSFSKELAVSPEPILKALRRLGVKTRNSKEATSLYRAEVPPEYFQRYLNGESAHSLAQELNIAREAFLKALERAGIERRTYEEAMEVFEDLVSHEYLERYENGENSEVLAKELGISTESFLKCVTVWTGEWKKWQDVAELIAKELDPHATFQSLHEWGQPDIEYTEEGLRKIADAKANGKDVGDSIKYADQCDILEFWCLRNPQKDYWHVNPITQKRTLVVFRTPQQLLASIKDRQRREELKKELIKTFHLDLPDLNSFFEKSDLHK
ncbi:MAG: hypothetical protein ACFFCQ_18050, partial [Promethearchaeota archaeon]